MGAEALDMLMALNAGCSGIATIHANSGRDALEKLVSYGVLAGDNISVPFLRRTVASVMDLVVFLGKMPLERFKAERPLEFERAVESGELEALLVDPPSRREIAEAYVFGSIYLVIGIMLAIFIVWALLTH